MSLLRSGATLIFHNAAYDCACALAWWDCTEDLLRAYEEDRILDTLLWERVAEIGGSPRKNLSLAALYRYYGLGELAKNSVQTSYGPLYNRPLCDYTSEQIEYSRQDAIATLRLRERQRARVQDVHDRDVAELARKMLTLHLISVWGLRTDPAQLGVLAASAREHLEGLREAVSELGIIRANGSKNLSVLRGLISEAYQGRPPLTEEPRPKKGAPPRKKAFLPQVKTSRSVLLESGDPRLETFADYGEWSSVENLVIPAFSGGVHWPIHTRFNLADTTRVTSSAPNIQNIRRKPGVRECFIPRLGHCFVAIDHTGLENATLAQVIVTHLGLRRLADFINSGGDLHCLVGAQIYGCSYSQGLAWHDAEFEPFETARSAAKPINFGRPGGAGWKTLKFIAKQIYGFDWTEAQTRGYIQAWERAVPDGREYLRWVSSHPQDAQGRFSIQIPGTSIVRRGLPYCSAANNGFQALGAAIESKVGWAMTRERLTPGTVLARCALVNFVHDEWIWEVPIGLQTQAAARLEQIMCEVPRSSGLLPDVKLQAAAKAMARWSKRARRIVQDGELQIWGA